MISQTLLCLILCLSSAALPGIGNPKVYPPNKSIWSTCRNLTTEYFDSRMKRCCSKCPPGTRILQFCTETSDTLCGDCGLYQYTAFWNRLKKCIACEAPCSADQEMVQNCTSSTKRICQCHEGLHCIDAAGKTCNRCRKHTACQEGDGVVRQGTKDFDVKCAPCAAGTFSNKVSPSEPCHPHTECALLWRKTLRNGTSTSNSVCSNELLPQAPVQTSIPSTAGPSSPAPIQVTHPTEVETESAITSSINTISVNTATSKDLSTVHSVFHFWVLVICGSLGVVGVLVMIIVCVRCKRTGKKSDLWSQNSDVQMKAVKPVETACLIDANESEPEVVSPRNGTCEHNGGVTGSVSGTEQLCTRSRSSSSESGGVRRKPDTGYSSKEMERTQTHLALTHLNNYSRIDSQEDQGYISRESRPSSGAPSPVIEFGGNPTVSVTINTNKCYVNCCHHQGDGTSCPVAAEEEFPALEEEGTEVDEGFPIQEEQKDLQLENWKEAGVPVEAKSEAHWQQYNSMSHQEDEKELQLPIQDTSGNIY